MFYHIMLIIIWILLYVLSILWILWYKWWILRYKLWILWFIFHEFDTFHEFFDTVFKCPTPDFIPKGIFSSVRDLIFLLIFILKF